MSKRKLQAALQSTQVKDEEDGYNEALYNDESESEEESDDEVDEEELNAFKKNVKSDKNGTQAKTVGQFKNKQRVLVFCARGTPTLYRHLMNDLRKMLPHSKKEVKFDTKDALVEINEICELKSCNNCIFFEVRKKLDCYMWLVKAPHGPSARFLVNNVHTMGELKLIGNCLNGARPLLVFDKAFDSEPHYQLLKEMFSQAFGTPKGHPNSKPFVDHVISFFIQDGRIWFRNHQISDKDDKKKTKEFELAEIGPRFVLNPIKIFNGSFGGAVIYQNSDYISPNQMRAVAKRKTMGKYAKRVVDKGNQKEKSEDIREFHKSTVDDLDTLFDE